MNTNHHAHLTAEQRELLLDHYDYVRNKARVNGDRYGQIAAADRRAELERRAGVFLSRAECDIARIIVAEGMYA